MPQPTFFRKIWHYDKANFTAIKRAIFQFDWKTNLANHDPSWQVSFFNKTFLNIISNFIPNAYIKVQPKDPPWINNDLRRMIKRQNRQYKCYVKNGCKDGDKIRVDNFRNECFEAINKAKSEYLRSMGAKLTNQQSGQKNLLENFEKID